MATIGVGKRTSPKTGRFVKTYNDIGYVATKSIMKAANLYTKEAYPELLKMSRAFLESYKTEQNGQAGLPRDKGHLIDSTSIVVQQTELGSQRSIHLDRIAPQSSEAKWGNWGGIGAGVGRGVDYRMDRMDDTMELKGIETLGISLRIGIPYSVPLNELGAGPRGKHRGFFRWFSEDFRHNVLALSAKVASEMNDKSEEALIFEGKR